MQSSRIPRLDAERPPESEPDCGCGILTSIGAFIRMRMKLNSQVDFMLLADLFTMQEA
jgi:hypothetical protein